MKRQLKPIYWRFERGQTALEYVMGAIVIVMFAATCFCTSIGEVESLGAWIDLLLNPN